MTAPFSDQAAAADYAGKAASLVPGLQDLHRMAGVLLAECVPDHARILVLGAGGGLELKAFAQMQPGWHFTGVDPSAAMLDQAKVTLGALAARVHWHQGYIDSTPREAFDGAACLLTLHFLPRAERLRTLQQIHQRLKPGAPLVLAHHSFPISGSEGERWLARYAAFAAANGACAAQAASSIAAFKEKLPVLTPQQDTALLAQAGFSDIDLFYGALTFRGWVARKA
ncbi:class I SAM-dependent methyltransferase [Kerstersia sp.]|uniref:class I SAM-dependent methyltransferase n=1 Tax=Kerstersia sp. TaxID=1930783 RepID=UPI003F92003A